MFMARKVWQYLKNIQSSTDLLFQCIGTFVLGLLSFFVFALVAGCI